MKIKNDLIKNLKNRKKLIILLIILVVLLITGSITFNKEKVIKIAKKIFRSETKEITYEVTSNENNKIKITVQATDTENGISELGLPDGDKIKTTKERTQLGIDYVLDEDGEYTFTSKSTTGEILTETIIVNNEFRNNLIGIEKIQEISTEQDYKITKKYDGNSEYKYYYAIGENNDNWIEIPEYQIVNVDEYKILENNWQNEEGEAILKVKKVGRAGNTVEVHKKIENMQITENLYNKTEQIIEGESIISCVRDNNIKSGNYTLKVNGEEYPAEIYNYDENVNYITNKNIGTSEEDNRMLIVKYNGNLNINERRLITAQTRKKGMFVYVEGELTNNGEISMTARGAKAEGQNVYLWKHDNGAYEYVPAEGGNGGKAVSAYIASGSVSNSGKSGENGRDRQTGGGGSGRANFTHSAGSTGYAVSSGSGTNGTSYSGGTGGGSALGRVYGYSWSGGNWASFNSGYSGTKNGGAGGAGVIGGTGNPGGTPNGPNGTGGLLIMYVNKLNNLNGNITANGVGNTGGGASGGGTITIFYNKLMNEGTIKAEGGKTTENGGNGGDGSVWLQDINLKSPTISISENKGTSIKVDIVNYNSQLKEVTYDYYVNDNLKIENSSSLSEEIYGFKANREYKIKVVAKYKQNQVCSNILTVIGKKNDMYKVELANKFDKYIYIDSTNGNDTTGNGTKEKPYSTLDKIAESRIIEKGKSYGVILKSGKYELTEKIFNLDYDGEINIIGNRQNTILKVKEIYSNYSGGKGGYNVNFYRLIWDGNNCNNPNVIMPKTEMNLYNIAFKNIASNGYSYFISQTDRNGGFKIENSTLPNNPSCMLRTAEGSIKLTNCYGGYTSGYGTTDDTWNYKTNYITSTPKVDNTIYEITDDESKWENVGTGTNPDGSQANLGVYGGEYSWEYDIDINF